MKRICGMYVERVYFDAETITRKPPSASQCKPNIKETLMLSKERSRILLSTSGKAYVPLAQNTPLDHIQISERIIVKIAGIFSVSPVK